MNTVEMNVQDLITAEYNPRQLSPEQYEQIKSSMLRFGCVDPVIVNHHPDRMNIIVGGHQRVKVWNDLGHDTIPCVTVSLPLEMERELNVRLNKNTGSWDWDELANNFDIGELCEWGFDEGEMAGFGDDDDKTVFQQISNDSPVAMVWALVGIPVSEYVDAAPMFEALHSMSATRYFGVRLDKQ